MASPTDRTRSAREEESVSTPDPARLPVRTLHCRFCNHLLLASSRDIARLPRRREPAKDAAIILPLPAEPEEEEEIEEEGTARKARSQHQHATLLLSTTLADRKPTLVRRDDGIEKRLFLRCGRCRVPVGYFLDGVHFPAGDQGKVVYLLPGALMDTDSMGEEDRLKAMDREWSSWST
jgi:hypothetical protein